MKKVVVAISVVVAILLATASAFEASAFEVTRELPEKVARGQTFDVTVTFTPYEKFIAVGLHDEAPWVPEVNKDWCEPEADQENVNGTAAEYIWYEIANGTEVTAIYKVTVPEDAAGTYTFSGYLFYYDPEGVNHTVDVTGDSAVEVELPDLAVTAITPPEYIIKGKENTINVTIQNLAEIADVATPFNVSLYADGVLIDEETVEGLNASESKDVSFTWVPGAAGTYTLEAIVDPENVVEESDETNNAMSMPVEVIEGAIISGTIHEVRGDILPFATVELIKDGAVVDSTTADEGGNYTLIAAETGTYTVKASKEGYAYEEQEITIEAYEPRELIFIYDSGLIPEDPDFIYVLDCIWLWKGEGKLSFDTILDVIFYWKT